MSTVLEIQSRFKKSCICSCTGFSMLCHTDVVSETQEGRRRSLCMCMFVCFSMYRCVCECGTCVSMVYTQTHRFACLCMHRGQKRTLQSFTLCPNSHETEVSLVATRPQGSSLSAPYCTGVPGIYVATPDEWQ